MSDYNLSVDILRGQMAGALSDNEEQFFWTICEAVESVDFEHACEFSENIDCDPETVAQRLRAMADLICPGETA